MPATLSELNNLLENYDAEIGELSEDRIREEIRSVLVQEDESCPPLEWLGESYAFSFTENYPENSNRWGTYFGPLLFQQDKAGSIFEYPSLDEVTLPMLEYWEERACRATHPV